KIQTANETRRGKLRILIFGVRVCVGFRISCFGFGGAKMSTPKRAPVWAWLLAGVAPALLLAPGLTAQKGGGLDPRVCDAEAKRAAAIDKAKPSVVCVMAKDRFGNLTGNGSGVLIDEDGFALTNFHVTSAARSPYLKCGLPDGIVYDAILVG